MKDHYRITLIATAGLRSIAEQWALYDKGRTKLKNGTWVITDAVSVVTHAIPFKSFHSFGLGIDSAFSGTDPYLEKMLKQRAEFLWSEYGKFTRAHGMVWGGDFINFVDRPHCEMGYGLSLSELQKLYEFGGIKGVFERCYQIVEKGKQ